MTNWIDNTTPPNSDWDEKNCPVNDLGFLADHLGQILADHNGNEIVFHIGVETCAESNIWNKII